MSIRSGVLGGKVKYSWAVLPGVSQLYLTLPPITYVCMYYPCNSMRLSCWLDKAIIIIIIIIIKYKLSIACSSLQAFVAILLRHLCQGLLDRGKIFVHNLVQKVGFFGILLCASVSVTPDDYQFVLLSYDV